MVLQCNFVQSKKVQKDKKGVGDEDGFYLLMICNDAVIRMISE
jgi:hypothetical protein